MNNMRLAILGLSITFAGCLAELSPPPGGGSQQGTVGQNPGTNPGGGGGGSGPGGGGGGSGGSPVFGPSEPQLVDFDEDGTADAIDVEPDGDPDYRFVVETCGEPRIDADRDGRVEALDIDCNGQIDLLVGANHAISPAPGANCSVGEPGEGKGHGPGGYGC